MQRNEDRFFDLAELLTDWIWEIDTQGVYTYASPMVKELLGYSPEEVIGKTPFDLMPPEEAERVGRNLKAAITEWRSFHGLENKNRHKDGRLVDIETNGTPIFDSSGDPIGYRGINYDITARKRAEVLHAGQQHILELVSQGCTSLDKVFEAIILLVESQYPTIRSSILRLEDNKLRCCSASSMPAAYNTQIDGLEIGPSVGSCGTAAYRRERVIVADVSNDPLWADYRQLGEEYEFSACWSEPIFDSAGEVLGTYTLYHGETGNPSGGEIQLLETMAHLAGIAIERRLLEENQRAQEYYFRGMAKLSEVLSSGTKVGQVSRSLMEVILSIFNADRAWFLYPCDPKTPSYRVPVEATRPGYAGAALEGVEIPIDELGTRLMTEALAAAGPLAMASELEGADAPDWVQRFRIRSQMILVLRISGDQPWLMGLHKCNEAHQWTEIEQKLFQAIGQRAEDTLSRLLLTERFREAEAYAQIGHWELDALSGRGYWSEELYRIMGLDPKTPAGLETLGSILHPDDRDEVLASIEKALTLGNEHFMEYRIRRPDGEERWLECRAKPEIDNTDQVLRLVGSTQNITERKRSDRALRESEEKFRGIFNNALVAMFRIETSDGRLLECNERLAQMLGYKDQSDCLNHFIYTEHHCDPGAQKKILAELKTSGEINNIEARLSRKDSTDIWVRCSGKLYPEKGYFEGVATDITAQKQAESELRKLSMAVQQSPVSIAITDPQGTIEYVNPKFSEVTGYSYEECIGRNPRILKSGEQTQDFYQDLWRTITSGREWRGVLRNRKKSGELLWENVSISPIIDQKGKISSFVAVEEDITERISAEEKERQRLLELAHVSRLSTMGEMASQIAHELNQPLTAIASTSDAVSRLIESNSLSTSEFHDVLDDISKQAQRAGKIIRHLRSFVRKDTMRESRFDVNKVIQDVLQLLKVELRSHALHVLQDLADFLPEVKGDQILIEQVILNLIRNAIDVMDDGRCSERKVLIKTQILEKKEIKVTIADTGPGLTTEALTNAFEPYYTTKESGMGMGLPISRSIIESHGGKLWATSEPEQGAIFCFILPIAYRGE